jgi:CopG family transcriptional regulator, nickel-responsive regulator
VLLYSKIVTPDIKVLHKRLLFHAWSMLKMSENSKVTRFSVSLPPTLVEKFDDAWKGMHYDSRSKAIHDAVRGFINDYESTRKTKGNVVGAVLMLYYLGKPGLIDEIMSVQHTFERVICSTLHVHLAKNKCMEMIVVKGDAQEVRSLAEILATKKGVQQVKVSSMAP